jgi:RHS repeat-associated protein
MRTTFLAHARKSVFGVHCSVFKAIAAVALLAAWAACPRAAGADVTLSLQQQTNGFEFIWNTESGVFYKLQTSSNLVSGYWETLAPLYANSNSLQWTDFNPPGNAQYYRVAAPSFEVASIEPAIVVAFSGSQIYITGHGLDANSSVQIGGQFLNGQTLVNSTLIQGGLPSLSPGYYNVQLLEYGTNVGQVLTNAVQIIADAASPALRVEPPGATPDDPSSSSCSRNGQNNPAGLFLFSGEVHSTMTDLVIPGVGMDFVWSRSYRSLIGTNTTQGNGWTFGYNIGIRQSGADLILTEGNSRQDIYFQQPDGSYSRNGFMREGSFDTNGNFILKFPDNGTWTFYPMNVAPGNGHISAIQDRNGNSMRFDYDFAGRLLNVIDTLNRTNTLGYDGNGFVSTVTDFSGRQVTYAYYQNGDGGGAFGDLKSATGPAVTGTPNGNDFPSGKTTTYTYTTGNGDDRLNHKLLTITDPKGQTWLRNYYSTNTNPLALEYGRVVKRSIDSGVEIGWLTFTGVVAAPSNNFATQKTIETDQMGNVREYFYDSQNRLVIQRDYTGRATAGQPTTDVDNRPTGKLRAGDPDYFEARYEYNMDSLPTRVTSPNGNVVEKYYQSDFDPAAGRQVRGNLRLERTLPGPLGGDQPVLTRQYEYDTAMGGCCGFNFVTKATDAQGSVTRHAYDSRGNRTNTVHAIPTITESFEYNSLGQMTAHVWPDNGSNRRRRDTFLFYTNGPQSGYLQRRVTDATNSTLTTSYEYDLRGNVIRKTDPRGNDSTNIVNELNQLVRQVSNQVTNEFGVFRYQRDIWYDANDKQVEIDVQNLDDQGVLQTNAYLTTTFAYDSLNYLTNVTQEVDATHNVVTEYAYDANRNRTLIRHGQAASGADPYNTATTLYDERNLPFQKIAAQGSADQSTTQYDYDANRNVVRITQGLEDTGAPRITTYTYDGYNRGTATTDAMGNVTTSHYDADGNLSSRRMDGEITDVPGGSSNARLAESVYTYDAMNRLVQEDAAFFDTTGGTNIGSGHAITRTVYSGTSQVLQTIDANNHTNQIAYDSANRRSVTTDAKNNTVTYSYDGNNNVVRTTEVDRSDLGTTAQTFNTTNRYDALDRLITTSDNGGITNRVTYDSRNNRVTQTDGRGNVTRYSYDGLNRLIATARVLTSNGAGSGTPTNSIVTTQSWDDNSLLTGQTDANSNTTAYAYDSLNRMIRTMAQDGTTNVVTYDVHGNRTTATDANGNVVTTTYDLLNRAGTNTISRGPGVLGTDLEIYQYDGLSRIVFAQNNDSQVTREFDSLSRIVRETQQVVSGGAPPRTVACVHDGVGNVLSCTYPGGRKVNYTYDNLNRQLTNSDVSGMIATYRYFGRTRVERRDFGNGTRAAYGYDQVRRMTNSLQTVIAGGAPIDSRSYAWDAAYNQTARNDLLAPSLDSKSFAYDSADRLVRSATAVAGPTNTYALDGVGNRISVAGGTNAGSYFMDPAASPADFQMNRYTTTPFDARTYDRNGSLVITGSKQFAYDYRNELLTVSNFFTNTFSAKYDCFGRRIEKSSPAGVARYYYAGWQEIEEQNGTNGTAATYAWGNELDELLAMDRGGQRYFFHGDDWGWICKVTDASHNVVEQYRYDDYGEPRFFNGSGASLAGTAIGNATLFTGRRYDPETGLFYNRTRYLEPKTGRFTTRDSIGVWGDAVSMGNAYTAFGNNPWTLSDPMGTDCYSGCDDKLNPNRWPRLNRLCKDGCDVAQAVEDAAQAAAAAAQALADKIRKEAEEAEAKAKEAAAKLKEAAEKAAKALEKAGKVVLGVVGTIVKLPGIIDRLELIGINHIYYGVPFTVFKDKPFYGNWCGRGNNTDANGNDLPPIDSLDVCCKAHDACAKSYSVVVTYNRDERRCNKTLCDCSKTVTYDSGSESRDRWNAAINDVQLTFCDRLY